jgi:hypothetical protein
MCCKGGWFTRANLRTDETDSARRIGLRVESVQGSPVMRLPCPKLEGNACTIYASWRPAVCGGYTCALLDRYLAGEVAEAEALAHVAAVVAMFERIVHETGPLADGLTSDLLRQWTSADATLAADGTVVPSFEARQDAFGLLVYYERHFRQPATKPGGPTGQQMSSDTHAE